MNEKKVSIRPLNRDEIKYLAIFAMTLDHIAYILLEPLLPSVATGTEIAGIAAMQGSVSYAFIPFLYRLFLSIGTFTGPVMIYFLMEGYFYTHDIKRYAKRLLLFALLSQLPFMLALETTGGNMLFTLLICLGVLYVHDHVLDRGLQTLLYILLFFISLFTDWNLLSVPLVLFLRPAFRLEDNLRTTNTEDVSMPSLSVDPYQQRRGMRNYVLYYLAVSCLCKGPLEGVTEALGMVLGFICIACFYNGELTMTHRKFHKYVFYIYYPAHLLVLWAIHLI